MQNSITLREKCPYSEFTWSLFSRIWTEYGDFPNFSIARKYGPEKLRIQTLFTHCYVLKWVKHPKAQG